LFDCITCDKCVPVCPNDANFTFALPPEPIPIVKLRRDGGAWLAREEGSIAITERHQIGNFADFCNDCGNCDVFCPEDGGPYVLKPRFFGTSELWRRPLAGDGFYVERRAGSDLVLARFSGAEYRVEIEAGRASYAGNGFTVHFDMADPAGTMEGQANGDVDLTYFEIVNRLRLALLSAADVNYINCLSSS
jgi:putative selenate reductase